MPELPEVETVRRGLAPALEGARIVSADVRRPDLRFPFPDGLKDLLEGAQITALTRRAKYLLIELDKGTTLIAHLGMSGSYRVHSLFDHTLRSQGERPLSDPAPLIPGQFYHERSTLGAHDHLVLHVEGGAASPAEVIYNDPRRFGFVLAAPTAKLYEHPFLAELGPEPLGNALTPEHLAGRFAGKRAPLKAALLDQKNIAGLGNIYVCEALSRAHLSPKRLAGTLVTKKGLPTQRLKTLTQVIRDVIGEAIEAGGSSLRDHKQTDGSLGYFQHSFSVYDREHAACPTLNCQGTVKRLVQSGRSTFYCPTCQR
ncbi:MAG: bifunctional DNA-formamidopyrimidine glycosylase/DNA-(apurinic or apyrimidinic site) lyase [Hyphomicrobiales bacterium]|jgi:formamidopyrimidine-DNA glycosylase